MGGHADDTWCRRRLLATCGAVATGAVAGCSGVLSTDGDDEPNEDDESTATPETTGVETTTTPAPTPFSSAVPTYGFEDGTGPFADRSQANSAPMFTMGRVFEGEQALALESDPGTETRCSVVTADLLEGTQGHAVWVNRYESDGPENAVGIRLRDPDSEAQVRLLVSGYHGGVTLREHDESGEPTGPRTAVTDLPADERWNKADLYVQNVDRITGRFGDVAESVSTTLDWTDRPVRFELFANAWGNGHAVSAAFDAVEIDYV
jgi:hypothetical protein